MLKKVKFAKEASHEFRESVEQTPFLALLHNGK